METIVRHGHVAEVLRDLVCQAHDANRPHLEQSAIASIARQYAWALYHDIELSTGKAPISPEMERRRTVPSDPGYFDELGAIEEFVAAIGTLGTLRDRSS
jgi:hypothetical protein